VALVGGEVAGAISARVDGERAWVLRWSVAPERRRQGLGGELLRALERRLLSLGVRDISMIVPGSGEATETARTAGYAQHEGVLYLEKRRLHTTSDDDRVDELGGRWLTEELWQSIGGMEREKDLIERRVILPLAERDEAKRHGVGRRVGRDPLRSARHRQDDVRQGDGGSPRLAVRRGVPEPARRHRRARPRRRTARPLRPAALPRPRLRVHRRGGGDRVQPEVRPSITASMAREFEEDIERFARF
jgi:hypothetical protein